jgi:DNA invertase Pin-like site-specific DNA recombinase
MTAVPPRAGIEQWQGAQTGAARVATASPPPHALRAPVERRADVLDPGQAGPPPSGPASRAPGTPTALRRADGARDRTSAAPSVTQRLRGPVVYGRTSEAGGSSFHGRVVAFASEKVDRDGGDPQPLYLVDDAAKTEPVWAAATQIEWPPSPIRPGDPVIGYVTVAPDDKLAAGDCATIRAAADKAGWDLLGVVRDRNRGGPSATRPGLAYALDLIEAQQARALVVSDVRKLSRSIVDLAKVMRRLRDAGAVLIGLDLGFDTSTPEGHYAAMVLIEFGVWERARIAERTRVGLERTKARGGARGRPAVTDRPELQQRIASMRAAKMTLQAIADVLNAEGVPTLRGGAKWRPSSVQAALGYRRPASRDAGTGADRRSRNGGV